MKKTEAKKSRATVLLFRYTQVNTILSYSCSIKKWLILCPSPPLFEEKNDRQQDTVVQWSSGVMVN
jgi:hypothetical protein